MEIKLNANTMRPECNRKWYHGLMARTFIVTQTKEGYKVSAGKYSGRLVPYGCGDVVIQEPTLRSSYLRINRRTS